MARRADPTLSGLWLASLSPGAWLIVALAVITTALIIARSSTRPEGLLFWTFSREHAAAYRSALLDRGLPAKVWTVPGADRAVIKRVSDRPRAVLATGDSAIIDATTVPVFDLARAAIEGAFGPRILRLDDMLE